MLKNAQLHVFSVIWRAELLHLNVRFILYLKNDISRYHFKLLHTVLIMECLLKVSETIY